MIDGCKKVFREIQNNFDKKCFQTVRMFGIKKNSFDIKKLLVYNEEK